MVVVGQDAHTFLLLNEGPQPGPEQDSKDKVSFTDVAGADEEKEELREIVSFLHRMPTRFCS